MTAPASTTILRRGPRYWLGGYRSMLRFDATGLRSALVFFLVIQVLMGAGMAIVYGFYFEELPSAAATYIATGAPTLAVIPVGMTLVPIVVAQHKLDQTYDFLWSLPVPRPVAALSTFTVFSALAIPGLAVTLAVVNWRYEIDLALSWAIVPAVLLVALMAVSVGWSVAHAVGDPRLINLLVNLVIFAALLFSPIAFPIDNFPGWLAGLHHVLPFWHMASVIRAGLTDGLVTGLTGHYLSLAAWTAGSWALAAWIVGRRR